MATMALNVKSRQRLKFDQSEHPKILDVGVDKIQFKYVNNANY